MTNNDIEIIKQVLGFEPSQEQKDALNDLLAQKNVSIDAVAGSGKTTLVIELALLLWARNKTKKEEDITGPQIVHLTYNKVLSEENKAKIKDIDKILKQMDKNNLLLTDNIVESRTIHSLGAMISRKDPNLQPIFYPSNVSNFKYLFSDEKLKQLLELDFNLPNNFHPSYLIVDEAQDLTPLFFIFIKRVYDKCQIKPTLLFIGDVKQAIYKFKDANEYFLKDIETLWNINGNKTSFVYKTLSDSYRLPSNLTKIFNNLFLTDKETKEIIKPLMGQNSNEGKIILKNRNNNPRINDFIIDYVKQKLNEGAKFDDFLILVFSVDKMRDDAIKLLHNEFINQGWSCYISKNDENADIKPSQLKNKIVFSTVHQAKGRERKYVILPYFDLLNYAYWLNNENERLEIKNRIVNLHYVAVTRFKKEMLVILDDGIINSKDNFIFKNFSKLMPYLNFDWIEKLDQTQKDELDILLQSDTFSASRLYNGTYPDNNIPLRNFTPTDLIKFIPYHLYSDILNKLKPLIKTDNNTLSILKVNLPIKLKDINIQNDKVVYNDELTIANSTYLLMEYFRNYEKDYFKQNLEFAINTLRTDEYFAIGTQRHLALLSYFNYDTLDFDTFNALNTSDKLRFWCYYLCIADITDSWLQLPHFNWLDDFKDYDKIYKIFEYFQFKDVLIEQEINIDAYKESEIWDKKDGDVSTFLNNLDVYNIKLKGRMDLMTNNRIFEFKCTDNLTDDHKLQLVVYLFLHNWYLKIIQKSHRRREADLARRIITMSSLNRLYADYEKNVINDSAKSDGVLLNYKTGEIVYIKNDEKIINEIVSNLIAYKLQQPQYKTLDQITDEIKALNTQLAPKNKRTR